MKNRNAQQTLFRLRKFYMRGVMRNRERTNATRFMRLVKFYCAFKQEEQDDVTPG